MHLKLTNNSPPPCSCRTSCATPYQTRPDYGREVDAFDYEDNEDDADKQDSDIVQQTSNGDGDWDDEAAPPTTMQW